jgi:hypothetical protein
MKALFRDLPEIAEFLLVGGRAAVPRSLEQAAALKFFAAPARTWIVASGLMRGLFLFSKKSPAARLPLLCQKSADYIAL